MKTKHIAYFPNWTASHKLNESHEDYEVIKEKVVALSDELLKKLGKPDLSTQDLMKWFGGLIELYREGKYQNYIFVSIKDILSSRFSEIEKFFTKSNTELTLDNIEAIKFFKQISAEEANFIKKADSQLKELGIID